MNPSTIADTSKYLEDNKPLFLEPQVTQYGSNMVMTNVMKPTKIKYINLDTRFATSVNRATGDYTIALPERVNEVRSMKVRQVEVPMTFYNVSKALGNNVMKVQPLGGKVQTLTVPDGNYTLSSLQTALNTTLFSALDLNIALASPGQQAVMQNTGNTAYRILWWDETFFGPINIQLGWVLGYRKAFLDLGVHGTPTATATSDVFANINTVRYMYLVIDEYSNSFQNSFLSPMATNLVAQKILCRIKCDFVCYPFGSILAGNDYSGTIYSDKRSYNGKVDLQRLSVKLVNEWGTPMDLNGLDFSFLLEIEYT